MEEILKTEEIPVFTGITCDSRQVKDGFAFVAIKGFDKDGNEFINDAINRGASVIFTEKKINNKWDIPVIQVDNARSFLGKLSAKFYNFPSKRINLIGVTGTNGKTTTSHLIYHLLNYVNKKTGLIGTVKVDTGKRELKGGLTTPPPVLLQKYLNEMAENNLKYASMEVSSHGIKLKRIAGTEFAIKVGTNISLDHFDLHPDFLEYIKVKKSFLRDNNEKTLVLINQDDPYLKSFGEIARNQVNISIQNRAEIMVDKVENLTNNTTFTYLLTKPITVNNKTLSPCKIPIKMRIPGEHNIYNALIAITIGLYYDLDPTIIKSFFRSFTGVWRRLQIIYNNDFTIIDDCAHNPGSYEAVFKAVSKMDYKRLLIVNSLRGNRGAKINRENAKTISKWLSELGDYQLLTSNCTDVVKPIDYVNEKEEKAFLETLIKSDIQFDHFNLLKKALAEILACATRGDLILLLGPHAMDHAGEIIMNMLDKK